MSLINCAKVSIKYSTLYGFRAFAGETIHKSDLIEKGTITWINPDHVYDDNLFYHNKLNGFLNGCAHLYSKCEYPNSIIYPNMKHQTYEIRALKRIKKNDILTINSNILNVKYKYYHSCDN
jgi:hypothetical protein